MNIEALRQAVKFAVTEHEHEQADPNYRSAWHQGSWAEGRLDDKIVRESDSGITYRLLKPLDCGTSCCLAGSVVVTEGWQLATSLLPAPGWQENWEAGGVYAYNPETGDVQTIPDLAQQILGITGAEGEALFNGSNKIHDVVSIATRLAKHYGHELGIEAR